MIRFSIVTITYNAGDVLKRTLDSIAAQSYQNVEHIIVDGASTDNTLAIANDYAKNACGKGHDIRIYSEPDKGLYDAMNKGIRYASGHYVCFMNAGDFYPDCNTLTNIANCVAKGTNSKSLPAVLYGQTDIVDNDGNFICHRRLSPPERLTWRSFRHGMLVCHQAFYARVDIAKATPYDLCYHYSADVDWCIRIMKKAEEQSLPLTNLHQTIANYAQEGETTRHHKESLIERFKIMSKHYGTFSTVAMHIWFVIRNIF